MSNLLRITNKIEALGIWDSIPSDSINSVVIEFEFAEDWRNLLCVAQFTQGEKTYNVVIENNRCVLPTELKIGNVMLSVFGTKTDGTPFRETSIPFCFEIYDAGFSSTAETPIPPTPDLYEQLIDKFAHSSGVAALNGKTGNIDIVADEGISVDDTETGKIKIKSTATITVDSAMSDTSENPVQNKVITVELKKLKELGETQSDWNINDNTSPSYIKNRPFYSEKVESDVWEFELPVINEVTDEGLYPTIPMPDADFSQFTDKQELNFYVTANTVSGDTHLAEDTLYFYKDFNIRALIDESAVDPDVPETLPCICSSNDDASTEEERYSPELIFGISIDYDIVNQTVSIHYTPSYATTMDGGYTFKNNKLYPVQVHFENFRNRVEQVHQIPEKYLKQTENKKWKYEYKVEPKPFENQPTVANGRVNKLKPNSFYFVELSQSTSTFKLCYGAKSDNTPIYVDSKLEFNLNNAWDTSSDEFHIIHCISVDTKANKAIFGKANDSCWLDYIIPNGTKNIKFSADVRTINTNLENSIIPEQDNGTAGFLFAFTAEPSSSNYNCDSYVTKPVILKSSDTITVAVEGAKKDMDNPMTESLYELPFCPSGQASSIKFPYYNGLTHYEFELKVSNDRRSLIGNGNVTGICWKPIIAIQQATPVDMSSIQISYPINSYFRLVDTEKKLLFVENEGNPMSGLELIGSGCLVGSSITIEGEIE